MEQDDKGTCRSLYLRLLRMYDVVHRDCFNAGNKFVRELSHTARCDHIVSLEIERQAHADRIGLDSEARVATYEENNKDRERARDAVLYLEAMTVEKLRAGAWAASSTWFWWWW